MAGAFTNRTLAVTARSSSRSNATVRPSVLPGAVLAGLCDQPARSPSSQDSRSGRTADGSPEVALERAVGVADGGLRRRPELGDAPGRQLWRFAGADGMSFPKSGCSGPDVVPQVAAIVAAASTAAAGRAGGEAKLGQAARTAGGTLMTSPGRWGKSSRCGFATRPPPRASASARTARLAPSSALKFFSACASPRERRLAPAGGGWGHTRGVCMSQSRVASG